MRRNSAKSSHSIGSGAGRPEPERLQKVFARAGLASRRVTEDWIRAGRITVNGQIATLGSGAHLAVMRCEPAGGEAANRWYTLAARGASGKDVRQLFERQGALVSRVLRTQLGPIALERSIARGQFRELNPEELRSLLS